MIKEEIENLIETTYKDTFKKYGGGFTFGDPPIENVYDVTEKLVNLLTYAQDSDTFSVNDEVALEVAIEVMRSHERDC